MGRVARWSVAHRWIVVAGWVLLALIGGVAAAKSGSRLSVSFALPGQPAYETNTAIVKDFGSGGDNPPLVVVVQLPPGTTVHSAGVRGQLQTAFGSAAAALPGARVASWISTGDRAFVSADGRTTFELLYPVANFASADPYATALPRLTAAVAGQRVDGVPVRITGASVLSAGGHGGGSSVLAETMLAGLGALVILAVVFGSLIALTPLVIAAIAIPSAFVFIYALTYVITMSTLVQNIVALVGLGVAIDYALLIVTRWREERGHGLANRTAVLRASSTAGNSVLFSGVTVTVSLAALALTSVPFLRSIGLAGMLIPLISIVVSATLLPVILDALGPRLEWPRRKPARTVSPLWTRIARGVVAHRAWAAGGALVVLAVLIAPVFGLNLGEPEATATAATAPASSRAGLDLLTSSGLGPGVLRPTEILLPENTTDTDEAVIAGIGHTGRLVTSGALILCLAFIALGGVPQTDVKILSTGLAAGIIIDATIIRGILAPALVALLGHFNWWLPAPVARLLRVAPMTAGTAGSGRAGGSRAGSAEPPADPAH